MATSDVINLSVITGIKFSSELIHKLNHLTYLFDADYKSLSSKLTKGDLNYCIFNVTKCQEVMQTEVSAKPMLFYDQQTTSSSEASSAGAISVIADNVIIQPKAYQIEALLSEGSDNLLIRSLVPYIQVPTKLLELGIDASSESNASQVISNVSGVVLTTFAFLFGSTVADITEAISSFSTSSEEIILPAKAFKTTLENMWKSRRLLKMKVWDSWDYKYGVIKNLTIDKEPTDNNNTYKITMTFQEMPILTYRDETSTSYEGVSTSATKQSNLAKTEALASMES